jgi:hypothetical protein
MIMVITVFTTISRIPNQTFTFHGYIIIYSSILTIICYLSCWIGCWSLNKDICGILSYDENIFIQIVISQLFPENPFEHEHEFEFELYVPPF